MCWVFIAVHWLSLVSESGGNSLEFWASHCATSTAKRGLQGTEASVVAAHRLSYPAACGIFPDQGSNLCFPCIGRQTANPWTTREVLFFYLYRDKELLNRDYHLPCWGFIETSWPDLYWQLQEQRIRHLEVCNKQPYFISFWYKRNLNSNSGRMVLWESSPTSSQSADLSNKVSIPCPNNSSLD